MYKLKREISVNKKRNWSVKTERVITQNNREVAVMVAARIAVAVSLPRRFT